MKYQSEIIDWGEEALYFLEDESLNFIILFHEGAPEELKEVAILHKKATLFGEPAVGDKFFICGKHFEITAVGEEAKRTFKQLGHCTLCFSGEDHPQMPGYINVKGLEKLEPKDIRAGGEIRIS
ncbi:MAG TPA: PTS sorbitol transporter subunit IIA [Pasteurellaceae bacterium]|nr:PTS sorbitol transporter subunit IIA [Pasteurellaceae bacterium]